MVTTKDVRMRNIVIFLSKAMFKYSQINKVDDVCIMVNPKHVDFYKRMFLFEPFGPELFYAKVQAPAVPLRVDMEHIEERLYETYAPYQYEEDLYTFFCRTNTTLEMLLKGSISHKKRQTPRDITDFFKSLPNGALRASS